MWLYFLLAEIKNILLQRLNNFESKERSEKRFLVEM